MSSTGSPKPSGFTSAMANRRRPLRNSNTSAQDRELSSPSIPRAAARTTQSIRRRLGMIGIERDRSLRDLNTTVQNLALEPSSTPSRPLIDRRTQELVRRSNSRDATEARLISVLQELHVQPSPASTRNDSQLISGPIPGDEESGSQPTSHTPRNHQQFIDRTRHMPYRTRTGISTMLPLDPQSSPLGDESTQEVGRQMGETTNTSQQAESSPKFGGTLPVSQSQEQLSPALSGIKRGATQGPGKEAETDISTATTEEGWEMVAPSRGNGSTTATLKRIDELRAQRQKTFEEYMEETAEWLLRADEKLDKYRSKSEALREDQRSRPNGREKMIGNDSMNSREQSRGSTEENGFHSAHEEAEPSSKDICLYCFNDKCEGCLGR